MYFWEMRICSEILFGAFALAKQLKVFFFLFFLTPLIQRCLMLSSFQFGSNHFSDCRSHPLSWLENGDRLSELLCVLSPIDHLVPVTSLYLIFSSLRFLTVPDFLFYSTLFKIFTLEPFYRFTVFQVLS